MEINKKDGTIVVIDDNSNDQVMIKRVLEKKMGFKDIIMLNNGLEAIEYFSESPKIPKLIFLDINMPKLNGLDVLQKLREYEEFKFMPIIMLTTSNESSDIKESYKRGANSYLCKPVGFNKYSDMIMTASDYWINTNHTIPTI